MPQMVLEVSPELRERVNLWGNRIGAVPENLAVRALEEYIEDLEDYYEAAKISAEIEAGRMETYSLEEVKARLGLEA